MLLLSLLCFSIYATDIKIGVQLYMSSIVCCYFLYCVLVFIPMT